MDRITRADRASRRWGARIGLSLTTILASGIAFPALAQEVPPVYPHIDENGVELRTGKLILVLKSIAIGPGGPGSLQHNFATSGAAQTEISGYVIEDPSVNNPKTYSVVIGGRTETFALNGTLGSAPFTQKQGRGSTLVYSTSTGIYTYTGADGTVATFGKQLVPGGPPNYTPQILTLTYPAGEKLTYYYRNNGATPIASHGLISVASNLGYQMRYTGSFDGLGYYRVTNITAFNMANETCDPAAITCTLAGAWPSLSYNATNGRMTDVNGDWVSLTATGTYEDGTTVIGYPSGKTITYTRAAGRVTAMNDGRGTWTYEYPYPVGVATIVKAPGDSIGRVVEYSTGEGRVLTDTVAAGGIVAPVYYGYDGNGRMLTATRDGVQAVYTYDSRGNVTQTRIKSKTPGTPADVVTTASYPATCGNQKICNKPEYTIDARGNRTDYTYDPTHGGVLSVTLPAASGGGVRPQTRYGYTSLQASYKNGAGATIQGPALYRLTTVSQCQTVSSCAAAADEVKTTIAYGANDALLPVSVSEGAGNGSLTVTTATSYTPAGDIRTVDGPLAGSDDTSRTYYDAGRRPIGTIGPDPDGAGALPRAAARLSYDADGNLVSSERGTATSQGDAAMGSFTALEKQANEYDAQGRLVRTRVIAGGTTYAVQQTSYTDAGRVDCVAQRMNPAAFASLPASACTLGTAGGFGPDRIARIGYDAAGRASAVTIGYGTAVQAVEQAYTYRPAGQVATLTDANGNRTTYEYDGFNRLLKTRYPVTDWAANASSTTDYEQLGYDAASNVTSRRLRDGTTIAFAYDNLNRLTLKDLPGSEPDASYTYDLLGRLTGASQTGHALGFAFDALGRNTSATGPLGTVSYQYDAAGRRTRTTWPDGFYVTYDYRVTGEMSAIRENGAGSGVGVLATFGYDALGRRTSVTRGNGVVTSYGYDAVSRLASFTHNLSGTASDLTTTFAYSPASQIVTGARSNSAYAWSGAAAVNRNYSRNGLNQYTASGAVSLGYDARGNLVTSGSDTFGYRSENLLASATVGGVSRTLAYDPALRLYETAGGTTTRFQYDGASLIAEYNGSNVLQKRYVHGPGVDEPLVEYAGAGTGGRTFLAADERGSVIARSDSAGAMTKINSYDEYGIPAGANQGRFQYTGQTWLPEVGMYYYKARVYSPSLGRFLQTDPIGYADGPNLYAYVRNDPVNRRDPTGTEEDEIVVTGTRPSWGTGYSQSQMMGGGHVLSSTGQGAPAKIELKQAQNENRDPGCAELLNLSNSMKGVLPPYVTNDRHWNNPALLRGYQNLFQSNADEFRLLDNLPAQVIITVGLFFIPGTNVVRLGSTVGGAGALYDASSRRQLNLARVRAIELRLAYMRACKAE